MMSAGDLSKMILEEPDKIIFFSVNTCYQFLFHKKIKGITKKHLKIVLVLYIYSETTKIYKNSKEQPYFRTKKANFCETKLWKKV